MLVTNREHVILSVGKQQESGRSYNSRCAHGFVRKKLAVWQLLPSPKTGTALHIVGASETLESKHCAISVTRVGFDLWHSGLQILRMTCSKNAPTVPIVSAAPCAIIVGARDLRQLTMAPKKS